MGTNLFWAVFIGCCLYDAFRPGYVKPKEPTYSEFEAPETSQTSVPGVSLVDSSESLPSQAPGEESGFVSVDLCNSCGFKSKFDELRTELAAEMPNVTVAAGEYPIATPYRLLGEFLSSFKIIFLVFLFFGDWIKAKTGFEFPYYEKIKANKLQAGLGVFALCSLLSGFLLNSGAFEVSYNGALIFSKLKTGRMPHPREILSIIRNLP